MSLEEITSLMGLTDRILNPPAPLHCQLHVNDSVEATGLVGGKHLNGKVGTVTDHINPDGRLAVFFRGEGAPKLIKRGNLKLIPYDQDDPRIGYPTKTGEVVSVLLQNDGDKTCTVCLCNLKNQYCVCIDGQLICERHYAEGRDDAERNRYCVVCHEFVPLRDGKRCHPNACENITQTGDFQMAARWYQLRPDIWLGSTEAATSASSATILS